MSDENVDVNVGDDVVTDIPVDEAKPKEAEEVAGEKPTNEDANAEVDKDQDKQPDKPDKSRIQKRIDEYAKKTHNALREADYWKQKALSSEGTKKELAEHEAEKAESALETVKTEAWQAKIDATREKHPDYDSVVLKSKAHVEPHVIKSVFESDIGPELLHHFASNPEALEKINGMNPRAADKEILRLELMLESKDQVAPTAFKKTSTAPDPVKPVHSNRGVVQKPLHEMTQEEYEAHRKKNGAKW